MTDDHDSLRARVVAQCAELSDKDVAWIELEEFAIAALDGDKLPAHVLRRIAEAIQSARREPNALLYGLHLKRRGRPPKDQTAALLWGERLVCLEDDEGVDPEKALEVIESEGAAKYPRTTLQEWRDSYRKWQMDASSRLERELRPTDQK